MKLEVFSALKKKLCPDITVYLVEWPKSNTLTPANASENVEQQGLVFIAEKKTGTAALEGGLQFLRKLNIPLTWDLTIMLLDIYPRVETLYSSKNLHMDI